MIATADGSFYQYFLDGRNGGECALLKQFRCGPDRASVRHVCAVCALPDPSTAPVCSPPVHSFLDSADPAETTPMVGTDRATSPAAV